MRRLVALATLVAAAYAALRVQRGLRALPNLAELRTDLRLAIGDGRQAAAERQSLLERELSR